MKLYNKSSKDLAEVADGSVDIAFVAPPYNIGTTYGDNNDLLPHEAWVDLMETVMHNVARVLSPTGLVVIEASDMLLWNDRAVQLADYLQGLAVAEGLSIRERHINFALSKDFITLPEHGWHNYFTDGNAHSNCSQYVLLSKDKGPFTGGDITYENFVAAHGHPCPTPQGLLEKIVAPHMKKEMVCLDVFMGIGTFGQIARTFGATYIGYELDAKIFATAKQLLQNTR